MAAGDLQFDLVSPERRLASSPAQAVEIPGADGDLTAMAGHAPTVTTLRPGILRAQMAGGAKAYVVTGGFAEISGSTVSVLAERALPVEEANAAFLNEVLEAAKAAVPAPGSEGRDAAEKLLADVEALKAMLHA